MGAIQYMGGDVINIGRRHEKTRTGIATIYPEDKEEEGEEEKGRKREIHTTIRRPNDDDVMCVCTWDIQRHHALCTRKRPAGILSPLSSLYACSILLTDFDVYICITQRR